MNTITTLMPYVKNGVWQFDDPSRGLKGEAFVCGIDTMLDLLTADIKNARDGVTLLFSETPFPGFQVALEWVSKEFGGNWYKMPDGLKGWLCPALYKYFDVAPKNLYIQIKPLSER